ncbi:glycoside hydrolase family 3 protein [Humibacter ginsengisoli]
MSDPEVSPDFAEPLIDMTDADARARAIAATLLPGFSGIRLPGALRDRLADGLGGVCVFGPNIVSEQQLRELNDDILSVAPHAVIAIDEEGGDVTRLNYAHGSPYPGNAVLGRLDDVSLTERVGHDVGVALRRTGCTLDFAPVIDVNSNPDNPVIGVRSFGAEAELVARHGVAWITGIQSTGVAACAKHFPGHGDTALDSHLALPVIDRSLSELRERELVPFRAAVDAGVLSIMTSHIVLPQVDAGTPATFSSRILQGLLRDELGFEGVIATDALDMKGASGDIGIPEAAVRALAAGCDLLCLGTDTSDELLSEIIHAVGEAIDAGQLSVERVADAAHRVRALGRRLEALRAGIPQPGGDDSGVAVTPDRAMDAFEVQPGALDALRDARGPFAVVRLETEANIAVGVAPWGPFAQVVAEPQSADSVEWAGHPEFIVSESDAARGELDHRIAQVLAAVPAERGVVVIGKAVHRHPFARATVDALRSARTTLVVDLGWPSDDRAYADIATFGASRLIGRALMSLLNPPSGPENRR